MKKWLWFWLAILIFMFYGISMFLIPVIKYQNWVEIQKIWERWQALNVGVLAFGASILLWWTAQYRSKKEDQRKYKSSRIKLVYQGHRIQSAIVIIMAELYKRKYKADLKPIKVIKDELRETIISEMTGYIQISSGEKANYARNVLLCFLDILKRFDLEGFLLEDNSIYNKETIFSLFGDIANLNAKIHRLVEYGMGGELNLDELTEKDIRASLRQLDFFAHGQTLPIFNSKITTNDFYEKHKEDSLSRVR